MDGVEAVASPDGVGGRALDRRPVDDADLDDPLRAGPLEQARDLRPRDAELHGDGVLGLAELVIQPAGADELLEVVHGTDVKYRCASMLAPSSRDGTGSVNADESRTARASPGPFGESGGGGYGPPIPWWSWVWE